MTDPVVVVDEPRAGLFSNIVAIIGLIILIVVVIWGLVHLAGLSKGWFSGLFPASNPKITVQAPANVNSGDPFTVSWKYSTSDKGNYAFLYQCRNGLTLKNASSNTIPCGTAFTVGSATSVTVTPTLSGIATTSLPISVIFLPNATSSKQAQGSAVTVVRTAGSATTATNTNTPVTTPVKPITTPVTTPVVETETPTPTQVVTRPATPADLSVRIIAVGVIDQSGQFVNRAPAYQGDMAAAQFDISNVGGSRSSSYYFSSNLPTLGGYVYNSPAQTPLNPGDHVLNTLHWTQTAQAGTFTVTVTGDTNTANNFSSATIGLTGQGGYNYFNTYSAPQPYYYPQYQY